MRDTFYVTQEIWTLHFKKKKSFFSQPFFLFFSFSKYFFHVFISYGTHSLVVSMKQSSLSPSSFFSIIRDVRKKKNPRKVCIFSFNPFDTVCQKVLQGWFSNPNNTIYLIDTFPKTRFANIKKKILNTSIIIEQTLIKTEFLNPWVANSSFNPSNEFHSTVVENQLLYIFVTNLHYDVVLIDDIKIMFL